LPGFILNILSILFKVFLHDRSELLMTVLMSTFSVWFVVPDLSSYSKLCSIAFFIILVKRFFRRFSVS
jgi:hypothetical protein